MLMGVVCREYTLWALSIDDHQTLLSDFVHGFGLSGRPLQFPTAESARWIMKMIQQGRGTDVNERDHVDLGKRRLRWF